MQNLTILHPVPCQMIEECAVADDGQAFGRVGREPGLKFFDALLKHMMGLGRERALRVGLVMPPRIIEMREIEMREIGL